MRGPLVQRCFRTLPLAGIACAVVAQLAIAQQPPTADAPLQTSLWLPAVFGDHMVVQRDARLPVWGRTAPGQQVVVTLARDEAQTTADSQGRWRLHLPPQMEPGPHRLVVRSGTQQRTCDDVLVGEVWLCSGQSNMEWPVRESRNAPAEIAAASHPQIRLFAVAHQVAKQPQEDCQGSWQVCSPQTVADFSAVAYYFGRELQEELKVPVGLIHASWGGSLCEAWMSREALLADPDFQQILRRAAGDNIGKGCGMFNAMIHPLIPYALRGTIWYQGESNASRARQYQKLFPALIQDWRSQWKQGDFPFYYVQLAPLDRHDEEWVELQEAQLKTLSVPNTGMAVTHDLDEPGLHPINKQDVGKRLACWALARDYHRGQLVCSGPIYRSMEVQNGTIRVHFDHASALAARDQKPLTDFSIAGEDRRFHPATATIDGATIVVRSKEVPHPVAVRFAWSDTAQPNLVNSAGLPASAFRTDTWPGITDDRQ